MLISLFVPAFFATIFSLTTSILLSRFKRLNVAAFILSLWILLPSSIYLINSFLFSSLPAEMMRANPSEHFGYCVAASTVLSAQPLGLALAAFAVGRQLFLLLTTSVLMTYRGKRRLDVFEVIIAAIVPMVLGGLSNLVMPHAYEVNPWRGCVPCGENQVNWMQLILLYLLPLCTVGLATYYAGISYDEADIASALQATDSGLTQPLFLRFASVCLSVVIIGLPSSTALLAKALGGGIQPFNWAAISSTFGTVFLSDSDANSWEIWTTAVLAATLFFVFVTASEASEVFGRWSGKLSGGAMAVRNMASAAACPFCPPILLFSGGGRTRDRDRYESFSARSPLGSKTPSSVSVSVVGTSSATTEEDSRHSKKLVLHPPPRPPAPAMTTPITQIQFLRPRTSSDWSDRPPVPTAPKPKHLSTSSSATMPTSSLPKPLVYGLLSGSPLKRQSSSSSTSASRPPPVPTAPKPVSKLVYGLLSGSPLKRQSSSSSTSASRPPPIPTAPKPVSKLPQPPSSPRSNGTTAATNHGILSEVLRTLRASKGREDIISIVLQDSDATGGFETVGRFTLSGLVDDDDDDDDDTLKDQLQAA